MIRISKHSLNNSNSGKLASLDNLFIDYKHDLEIYINYIIDGVLPLKPNLSSKVLPSETILHSKYKREIYKQASSIIRSQIDKANKKRYNNYKKIYSYYIKNKPEAKFTKIKWSNLKLKSILKTKYFTIPSINDISINLTNEFYNLKQNNTSFDSFINLKLPYFNDNGTRAIQINLPFNNHKHSNKFIINNYKLRNNIQIKKVNGIYYLSLIWEKLVNNKLSGDCIAYDMGYKKLLVSSNNEHIGVANMQELYTKISRKKQGSKSFKRSLTERDNLINYTINKLDLSSINKIIIEDLVLVKNGKKYFNNKIQRWSYAKTIDKLTSICEVNGIEMVKVSPSYTSQTCSKCNHVDKKSRLGENFKCTSCNYEIDADYNASINIYNRGVYSPSN